MGYSVRIDFDEDRLMGAVKHAGKRNLRRAGAYIRKAARHAVHKSKNASAAGTPPNTRRGLLKRSILFGVESDGMSVVIGPAKSLIGISMTAHEFGGMYRGRKYPQRPLMGPTLKNTASQLPKLWQDSIK